ncbi:Beta-glucosidase OS=Streptomyces alboniger OX=132473 GN=CP975_12580 PE=3 SV=1 [Streptomyces alboniger]
MTLNEPWCSAFLGDASGVHAPGRTDPAASLKAAHHLNLAHGLGTTALRSAMPARNSVAVSLNSAVVRPLSPDSADLAVVRKIDDLANGVFHGPMLHGAYPETLYAATELITDWSYVQDGDLAAINQPLDALGLNDYTPALVSAADPHASGARADGHGSSSFSPWPGADDVAFHQTPGEHTEMGWTIDPTGLHDLIMRYTREAPGLPIYVTENGAAYDDKPDPDRRVHDPERISYLHGHLSAVRRAITDGADVRGGATSVPHGQLRGADGYRTRRGLRRLRHPGADPQSSADWYARAARTGTLPAVTVADLPPLAATD